jgi:hypothetical protein
VQHGHALKERILLWVFGLLTRKPPPEVLRALFYRPAFFGGQYHQLVQQALRGESVWSVGERELFAAFVSSRVQCRF